MIEPIPLNPGFLGESISHILSWLLTYLIHSTLLLTTAWIITKWLLRHSRFELINERIWKAALIGGLFTTSLQIGLGLEPGSGRYLLQTTTAQSDKPSIIHPTPVQNESSSLPIEYHLTGDVSSFDQRATTTPLDSETNTKKASTQSAPISPPSITTTPLTISNSTGSSFLNQLELNQTSYLRALIMLGFAVPIIGIFIISHTWLSLHRHIRHRSEIHNHHLCNTLIQLINKTGGKQRSIRLTVSDHLTVPIAFGLFRPEICLPPWVITDLDQDRQSAVLAHELSHLIRRDQYWLALSHTLEHLFFFQPLNRFARLHIQSYSEYACDAQAVKLIGSDGSLKLAKCLIGVADQIQRTNITKTSNRNKFRFTWRRSNINSETPVAAMARAQHHSILTGRVKRLLSNTESNQSESRLHKSTVYSLLLITLISTATLAPAITLQLAPSETHQILEDFPSTTPIDENEQNENNLLSAIALLDTELNALLNEVTKLEQTAQASDIDDDIKKVIKHLREKTQTIAHRRDRLIQLAAAIDESLRQQSGRTGFSRPVGINPPEADAPTHRTPSTTRSRDNRTNEKQ